MLYTIMERQPRMFLLAEIASSQLNRTQCWFTELVGLYSARLEGHVARGVISYGGNLGETETSVHSLLFPFLFDALGKALHSGVLCFTI